MFIYICYSLVKAIQNYVLGCTFRVEDGSIRAVVQEAGSAGDVGTGTCAADELAVDDFAL